MPMLRTQSAKGLRTQLGWHRTAWKPPAGMRLRAVSWAARSNRGIRGGYPSDRDHQRRGRSAWFSPHVQAELEARCAVYSRPKRCRPTDPTAIGSEVHDTSGVAERADQSSAGQWQPDGPVPGFLASTIVSRVGARRARSCPCRIRRAGSSRSRGHWSRTPPPSLEPLRARTPRWLARCSSRMKRLRRAPMA